MSFIETLLVKIEGIQVAQGLLGRLFGYGTIVVSGTGGSKSQFRKIADPLEFRRQVQQQIEALDQAATMRGASQTIQLTSLISSHLRNLSSPAR